MEKLEVLGSAATEQVRQVPQGSGMGLFELRNQVKGWHWETTKRCLDLLELTCPDQRVFDAARKQVLDWQARQERALVVMLHALVEA